VQELKADTSVKVVVGPVVDKDDALTPITTLDISTADEAEIIKHDAAAVTDISAYTWAAIAGADGYYNLTLPTGAVDTEGMLTVLINDDSLCLPVKETFMVLANNMWNAKYATGNVTVEAITADVITDNAIAADAYAGINTQVDTALSDIHLDHLLAATYDPASKPGAADALLNEMVENDAGVSRFTANALEQGPGGASAATIADAVAAMVIEGAVTLKQSLQLSNAAAAGKLSGAAGAAITIRDLGDTKDRITATVDAVGNRSAVTPSYD
jgi:hypothetical protein